MSSRCGIYAPAGAAALEAQSGSGRSAVGARKTSISRASFGLAVGDAATPYPALGANKMRSIGRNRNISRVGCLRIVNEGCGDKQREKPSQPGAAFRDIARRATTFVPRPSPRRCKSQHGSRVSNRPSTNQDARSPAVFRAIDDRRDFPLVQNFNGRSLGSCCWGARHHVAVRKGRTRFRFVITM